jgi:microcin C transport system substrate-binding protein
MRFILFVFTVFLIPLSANATNGIAMHGTPKYEKIFDHLSYSNPDAPKGGKITQCSIGTFDTLNDNTIEGKPADGLYLLNDPLMRRVWDEPFSLYGVIAKSIDIPNDRSSITFHLNSKAVFHDGSPITTKDVKFSFETLREKGKPNTRNVYNLVSNVIVTNKHKITFKFTKDHDQETALILAMMPVLSKSYWQDREFDATTLESPLGNGPYKISSIDAGKSIAYERVKDYWAADLPVNIGHYNFDSMTIDYYRDNTVALEAFQSGACDVRREFNPTQWQSAYDNEADYIMETLTHSRPEKARGFIFNKRRELLKDRNVRKALTLAFHFDWMNRTFFNGQAKRIQSTFPNSLLSGDFVLPIQSKRTLLKQANNLLNDAGYAIQDNGQRFTLTLLLNNPLEEKIALGYKKDLKRLGINLEIRTLDTAQFYGALSTYDYDMISWRWVNSLSPGTEQAIYWGCDAAKNEGSRNYSGLCNDDIDTTIKTLTQSKTYEDLVTTTQKLDTMIMSEYPFIPLYYMGVDYVARWPYINHPNKQSTYGMVLETWWHTQE